MSQSASQAAIFYRDVESSGKVWTIKDIGGFPAPKNSKGVRTMPFWSSESRAKIIIKSVPAYFGFEPVELDLDEFHNYWLMELKNQGQLVGINWSGKNAVGYDLPTDILINWIEKIKPKKKSILNKIFGLK